jgi:hypothetical protein
VLQLLQRAHYAAQNPEACDLEGDGSLLYVIDSFNADVNVASASFMWWRARMELQVKNRISSMSKGLGFRV